MIKETGINLMENFITQLRKFCQFEYLPFSTRKYINAKEIIEEFLTALQKVGLDNIICVTPSFHMLSNFHIWECNQLDVYSVVSRIPQNALNTLFTIQSILTEKDHSISRSVNAHLNKGKEKNGRLIIKINVYKKKISQATFDTNTQELSFLIPFDDANLSSYNLEKELKRFELKILKGISVKPKAKLLELNIKFNNEDIISLARNIFPSVFAHRIYLQNEFELYYVFSNNVIYEKEKCDVGLGGLFFIINKKQEGYGRRRKEMLGYLIQMADAISSRIINFYQTDQIMRNSRKAAIAQVMLRNLSHNIGSHVLNNIEKGELDDLIQEDRNKSFAQKTFSKDIVAFYEYLRTRMDLLADISTGISTLEFTRSLLNEVLVPLKNKKNWIVKKITGNDKKLTFGDISEILSSFPNDSLGVMAFYIIIENYVRNSAKHGNGNKIDLKFELDEKFSTDLLKISIYDENDEKNGSISKIVEDQNYRISKSVLDDDGSLREGSWGLLEMKVAAAYLRKIPVEEIDGKFAPPLLKAEDINNCLAYTLYLLKPKHLLIITKDNNLTIDAKYKEKGIDLFSLKKVKENLTGTFPHEIVLLIGIEMEEIQKVKDKISSRIVGSNLRLSNFIEAKGPEDLKATVWEMWYKELSKLFGKIHIHFLDDENKSDSAKQLGKNIRKESTLKALFTYHWNNGRIDDKYKYFESWGNLHPAKDMIIQLKNMSKPTPKLQSLFMEAINFEVSIVDERIQRYAFSEYSGEIDEEKGNNYSLSKMGVIIPPKSINLNNSEFSEELKNDIKLWISKYLNHAFMIIHLGIIEKILDIASYKDIKKKGRIQDYINSLKTESENIIITSGRGNPESLPSGVKFLHYSNIAQYVTDKRSKLHLINLLMSVRTNSKDIYE